jgi:hypothetical protein
VPETVAMKITGHKTRAVFDRYDITSEEDLTEAARKLDALPRGTIRGTVDGSGVVVPIESREFPKTFGGRGQNRTADTTIFSRMLYQLSYPAVR